MTHPRPASMPEPSLRAVAAVALALAAALAWTAPAAAQEPEPDSIRSLHDAIARERAAREALEARLAREAEAQRNAAARPTVLPIIVSGYVHVDWVVHRESSQNEVTQDGQPLNEDRFLLRRARLRGERDLGMFHGALELDANTLNGVQVRPVNAEATFKWPPERAYARTPWAADPAGALGRASGDGPPARLDSSAGGPWFMVSAGLFRTPFGFEVAESERERPWLERSSMSNGLFPQSFDLGLRVLGGFRALRYAFALMNGEPLGERTFPGRDPNESKDLVFRLGGASALTEAFQLEGGVSGVTGRGFHRGAPASVDVLRWRDTNGDGAVDALQELTITPGSPATPSSSFKRFAVGADLRARLRLPVLGELAVRAEIVRGSNLDRGLFVSDPVAATRDVRQLGYYVGMSQELTRWALVSVRYDRYAPDADAREQEPFAVVPRDSAITTWSFALAGRFGPGRLVAQYDKRENKLGRDVAGRPATLADDAFTVRAEVRF